MGRIYTSVEELVGHTPLMEMKKIEEAEGLKARLLVKLEYANPAGSVKDRVALAMIEDAEKRGVLKKGATIIEPTSGNTGIGLAMIAAARGYRLIIVMPETMSGSFIPAQFENPANPRAHEATTGPEIWEDTDGEVDVFVAGIGTGGTISGTGKYLKARKPDLRVIGVEPADSPVLSGGKAGPHKIQGIGAGFVPKALDTGIYDGITRVTTEDAFYGGRQAARLEGVLVGISSGAALWAAIQEARRPENEGKTIVALLPDSGDRYLSSPMFA